MKDKAIEFLQKKGYKTGYGEPYTITEKGLIDFMVDFAQQQVKNWSTPDVVRQSEHLFCDCSEGCYYEGRYDGASIGKKCRKDERCVSCDAYLQDDELGSETCFHCR